MLAQTANHFKPRGDQIPDLKEHLLTRVLPFWEAYSIDREHGGFITRLARDGSLTGDSEKFLVMQTRMVYSFAAGVGLGGPSEWLNMAGQGVAFLLKHFRDYTHDGWFWSTSREGRPLQTEKRTYGHAFAVYALAEYSRIAHDSRALAAATHTWSLVHNYLWDAEHDGAIETCHRTWNPGDKSHSMGTHLHLIEALLALNEAAGGNQFWPHARALCDLVVGRMVEPRHGCGLEHFEPDWTFGHDPAGNLVNYGHNLEAAWLLLRAHQVEGIPAYRDTARGFLDYCLRFGLDTRHGGVFSHGPIGQPASVREKIWWVQTEAMVAFLLGYIVFGEACYWEAFRNVVGFSLHCLHDPECGEWFTTAEEDGTPRVTDKGSDWKSAYHVTQACCYAHEYLLEIRSAA